MNLLKNIFESVIPSSVCPSLGMESLLLPRPDHDTDRNLIRAFGLSENLSVFPLVLIPSCRQCHREKKFNYLSYTFEKKTSKILFSLDRSRRYPPNAEYAWVEKYLSGLQF